MPASVDYAAPLYKCPSQLTERLLLRTSLLDGSRNRGMVQDLDEHSIRIFKIEGASAIPVCLDGLGQRNPPSLHSTGNEINVFRSWDNESNMMDSLNWPGKFTVGKLMNREIIAS